MQVRAATMDDMPALLLMSVAMHAESPRFRSAQYSEEKMFNIISFLIEHEDQGGVLVAESDAGLGMPSVVGMLGFIVNEQFFGHDKIATDLGIYVAQQHRGSSAFLRLVSAFEKSAVAKGAKQITLSINTGVKSQRTADMLKRLGYDHYGFNVAKQVA